MIELILMQRVEKLGQMGEVVKVRPGYARNFLLPKGRAIRANAANLKRFETDRSGRSLRTTDRNGRHGHVDPSLFEHTSFGSEPGGALPHRK